MREAVELRADLADFTGHDFFVAAARVPSGIHEGALGMHVENARAEEGHAGPEDVAELDHLAGRSEEHTSELQSQSNLVCRLLLEKKKKQQAEYTSYKV